MARLQLSSSWISISERKRTLPLSPRRSSVYRTYRLLLFSSNTEPEIVARTERVTLSGYVTKTSEKAVLLTSIGMAFKFHFRASARGSVGRRPSSADVSMNYPFLAYPTFPRVFLRTKARRGSTRFSKGLCISIKPRWKCSVTRRRNRSYET